MKDQQPIYTALQSTSKALANEPRLSTVFTMVDQYASIVEWDQKKLLLGKDASLALYRGAGDSGAFYFHWHDPIIYNKLRPESVQKAAWFDQGERVRIEVLTSQSWLGVAGNIAYFKEQQYRHDEEAKFGYWLYNMLMGKKVDNKEHLVFQVGKDLIPLFQNHLRDPACYLETLNHLIDRLLADERIDSPPPDRQLADEEEHITPPDVTPNQLTPRHNLNKPSKALEKSKAVFGESHHQDTAIAKVEPTMLADRPVASPGILHPYRVYTTVFDKAILANKLASKAELQLLSKSLSTYREQVHSLSYSALQRLKQLLYSKRRQRIKRGLEYGRMDPGLLVRAALDPTNHMIYQSQAQKQALDTTVTLLIDNSGSMRGRPIMIAALSAEILTEALESCGVRVEILGFTTQDWKGGKVQKQWESDGKPQHPGRLNALLHVIYKPHHMPFKRTKMNLGLMLKEGILKENIDGEALLWTYKRLVQTREKRKILMVISDGAPVDDATVATNGDRYLSNHLHEVIQSIQAQKIVDLIAIGIGHNVGNYYPHAITIDGIDALSTTLCDALIDLLE